MWALILVTILADPGTHLARPQYQEPVNVPLFTTKGKCEKVADQIRRYSQSQVTVVAADGRTQLKDARQWVHCLPAFRTREGEEEVLP